MRTFKKVLHTTTHWKQDIYQFLGNYSVTPHCTTGVSLTTALFGWPIRANYLIPFLCQVVKIMTP